MKLIAKLLLQPTEEQTSALLDTLRETNTACDEISRYVFEHKVFSKFKLQRAIYYTIKESFNLSAQVVVRAIGKVADSYKKDRDRPRTFKPLGAIAYDTRILRYYSEKQQVSIWTTQGREKIPYLCNNHIAQLMQYQQGKVFLVGYLRCSSRCRTGF
jgi:putative transposase